MSDNFKWEVIDTVEAVGDIEKLTKSLRKTAKTNHPGVEYKIECHVLSGSKFVPGSAIQSGPSKPVLYLYVKMPYTCQDAMEEYYRKDCPGWGDDTHKAKGANK